MKGVDLLAAAATLISKKGTAQLDTPVNDTFVQMMTMILALFSRTR